MNKPGVPDIIIEVRGGIVQAVYAQPHLADQLKNVAVLDRDIERDLYPDDEDVAYYSQLAAQVAPMVEVL